MRIVIPANDRPLVWAMASFHASTLVFVFVFFLWLNGDLHDAFDGDSNEGGTLIGLAAFAALWLASFVGTLQALPVRLPLAISLKGALELAGCGAAGGAITGGVFLVVVLLALIPAAAYESVSDGEPLQFFSSLALLLIVGTIGSFIAGIVGGIAGLIAGVLDSLLLALAFQVAGPLPDALAPNAEMPAT